MSEDDPYVIVGGHVVILKGTSAGKTEAMLRELPDAMAKIAEAFGQLGITVMRDLEGLVGQALSTPLIAADFNALIIEKPMEDREYVPRRGDQYHRGGAAARRRWKRNRATGRR